MHYWLVDVYMQYDMSSFYFKLKTNIIVSNLTRVYSLTQYFILSNV